MRKAQLVFAGMDDGRIYIEDTIEITGNVDLGGKEPHGEYRAPTVTDLRVYFRDIDITDTLDERELAACEAELLLDTQKEGED